MANNTFKRTESKYVLSATECEMMLGIIRENMDCDDFDPDCKGYMVYNIYYDNEHNSVIRNSVAKPPYKEKLRVRSYVVPTSDTKVYVEMKKKIKGVVSKRRVGMPLNAVEPFLSDGVIPEGKSRTSQQIMKEILYFQSIYRSAPTLYLSYRRFAFKGRTDKNFRVTIDRDITTRRDDLRLEDGVKGDLLIGDRGIMEVKYVGNMPLWLSKALYANGIRKASISKYGTEYANFRKSQLGRSESAETK